MDLPLVSATQIKLFDKKTGCQRKWGFKYLDKIPDPPGKGALLGTEVQDTQLDPYLGEGRPLDFTRASGEIANALLPLLPAPKAPGMRLRRKFLMPSPTGRFGYQGEFDVFGKDSVIVPGLVGGRELLGDVKTTSNLDYALTEATLGEDVQFTTYATNMLIEDDVDEFDVLWWYVRTRKPHRTRRVYLPVTGGQNRVGSDGSSLISIGTSHVVERFGRIDQIASELVGIKLQRPKVDELPPNARMCEAYGGCPYRNICNLSPSVHAAAVNSEALVNNQSNDFLARLRGTAPAAAPPAVPPVVHPTSTVKPVPLTVSSSDENIKAIQEHNEAKALGQVPAWAEALTDPMQAKIDASYGQAARSVILPPAINPPESALPPAAPVGAAAPAVETPKKRGRPAKTAVEAPGAPAGAVLGTVAVAAAPPAFVTTVNGIPTALRLSELVCTMRALGMKSLRVEDGISIELFPAGAP